MYSVKLQDTKYTEISCVSIYKIAEREIKK